jgi:hypothetical protein
MAENILPIHTERLYEAIIAVCPIGSMSVDTQNQTVELIPDIGATQAQIDAANAVIAAFDWSQTAYDAWLATKVRLQAQNALDAAKDLSMRVDKAVAQIMLQEINTLRQWIADFKTQTAAATNLANLQSRVASLPNLTQYTEQQLLTAIRNRI